MKSSIAFFIVFTLISFNQLFAQIGLNIHYHQSDYTGWNDVIKGTGQNDTELFKQSYQIGLDYGFTMSQYRVEFYPKISYKRATAYLDNNTAGQFYSFDFDLNQIGFHIRTQVYPLDLLSKKGMQCPTFHRGGDIFTKGWFLSFQPEIVYSRKQLRGYKYTNTGDEYSELDESKLVFGFGIGTGIDIGLNESFSLTPSIMYTFILGENWPGFSEVFNAESFNDGTSASYLAVGLRIGIWF